MLLSDGLSIAVALAVLLTAIVGSVRAVSRVEASAQATAQLLGLEIRGLRDSISELRGELRKRGDDHEGRIRELERSRKGLSGGST